MDGGLSLQRDPHTILRGAARNRIHLFGIHRQYKIRICQECGEMLRTYGDADDPVGNYVCYIQNNPLLSFAERF